MKVITYRLEDAQTVTNILNEISQAGVAKLGRSLMSIVAATEIMMNGVVQELEETETDGNKKEPDNDMNANENITKQEDNNDDVQPE